MRMRACSGRLTFMRPSLIKGGRIGVVALKHPAEIDAVVRRIDERIARRLRSDLGSRPLHRIGFQLQLAFDPQFGERCNRDRNAEPSWIQRTDAPGKKFKFVRIKRRSWL